MPADAAPASMPQPRARHAALETMGLSISDAIGLLMLRIADEQRLPFKVKVPNAATRRPMAELSLRELRGSWVGGAGLWYSARSSKKSSASDSVNALAMWCRSATSATIC